MTEWYNYPICVPFNDPNFDVGYGGSHDLDVATPPNTEVTSLVNGTVASIDSPTWGKQVGIRLTTPIGNASYFAILHLSAISPAIQIGTRVKVYDLIGWSGGCTHELQYAGTSNPTGENFLNTPDQSSQPQTGIALMRGPEYGIGAGWTQYPDPQLDPTHLLMSFRNMPNLIARQQAAINIWQAIIPGLPTDTGIFSMWYEDYIQGIFHGPAVTEEEPYTDWTGNKGVKQIVLAGQYEWINGVGKFYPYK